MTKQYCFNICYDTLSIHSILQRVKKQYQMIEAKECCSLDVLPC